MRFLLYRDLDIGKLRPKLKKVQDAVERDDFRTPDIKKLTQRNGTQGPYYRAKLDDTNRVLLTFVRHEAAGQPPETVCLALEIIHQHAYEKSRFLRGAAMDEAKLPDFNVATASEEAQKVRYLNPARNEFHLLDKVISFDDTQDAVYRTPAPVILVGSAGSGKTALTLQKLREMPGQVLYVTLSPFLAQSASELYSAHGFENETQEVSFLSFADFLRTVRVPTGREVTFEDFRGWVTRQPGLKRGDAHQLFEEFRGVLSSSPAGALGREEYVSLGIRQSIYAAAERPAIYDLFSKYLHWLNDSRLYDSSLLASSYRTEAAPTYDFVVVDEVQDLTAAQLALILQTLKSPGQFLLCGDSNQIVHPNFFSWAAVKSLLYKDPALAERQKISVLQANFRNSGEVTRVANDILKVKHARFGSVDRESNFLVRAVAGAPGSVTFLPDDKRVKKHLDDQTRGSTEYAVLVLRDEDKAAAREAFGTPLVFSVHEAKGLEYPNIILHNFISGARQTYAEIADGVDRADLQGTDELTYRRAKDKADKSLEIYKFYVNALYVAVTRAVERVILVENDTRHPLLSLLGVELGNEAEQLKVKTSSRDDWEREARKLELQGKKEQARDIRRRILQQRDVPWEVWTPPVLARMQAGARQHAGDVKRARELTDYALLNLDEGLLEELAGLKIKPAQSFLRNSDKDRHLQRQAVMDKYRGPYGTGNLKAVLADTERYGVDHRTQENLTPLMLATMSGQVDLVGALLERGADLGQTDMHGRTPHMLALERAMLDANYARTRLGQLWDRLKPTHLDVQVGGRLIRLQESGAEFYFLSVMLAQWPHYTSRLHWPLTPRDLDERRSGFFVNALQTNLEHFPPSVLREQRRKRPYFNHVMARAELESSYVPARKLWQRVRQGFYVLNPEMRVGLVLAPNAEAEWVSVGMLADALGRGWLTSLDNAPAS